VAESRVARSSRDSNIAVSPRVGGSRRSVESEPVVSLSKSLAQVIGDVKPYHGRGRDPKAQKTKQGAFGEQISRECLPDEMAVIVAGSDIDDREHNSDGQPPWSSSHESSS